MTPEDRAAIKDLTTLTNVGPAMARDFILLGIRRIDEIRGQNPDELYSRLCEATGTRQDPCVLDTFRAVVHNVEHNDTKPWWEFTPLRKQ